MNADPPNDYSPDDDPAVASDDPSAERIAEQATAKRRCRRLRIFLWSTGVIVVLAVVLTGAIRWPAGANNGGPIEVTVPTNAASLSSLPSQNSSTYKSPHFRLATFNIHSLVGLDGQYDPQRAANLLKGFDLVGLNEVRGSTPLRERHDQILAGLLNMKSEFFPTEIWWWRPWFGNAVLTSVPVKRWQTLPLRSGRGMGYRNVTRVELPFGDVTLNVLITHIGRHEDRAGQFADVAKMFLDLPPPAVWMGDMNTHADNPQVLNLLNGYDVIDAVADRQSFNFVSSTATKSAKNAGERIDFIFTRGLRTIDAGVVENIASDHPLVWAEVQVEE